MRNRLVIRPVVKGISYAMKYVRLARCRSGGEFRDSGSRFWKCRDSRVNGIQKDHRSVRTMASGVYLREKSLTHLFFFFFLGSEMCARFMRYVVEVGVG